MAAEEGFRVATAYVALTVEDGDVKAQIEQVITNACEQAGQEGGDVLTQEIAAKVDEEAGPMTEPVVEAFAQAGPEAAAAFDGELTPEIEATIREMGASAVEQLGAAGGESGAAFGEGFASSADEELAAWRASVAEAQAEGASISPDVLAAFKGVDEGSISAVAALRAIEASETAVGQSATVSNAELRQLAAALDVVGARGATSIEQLRAVAVSMDEAAASADEFGTSEAQLTIATAALEQAQRALSDEGAFLTQTLLVMGNAGSASFTALQGALKDYADAQAAMVGATQAQVDALNQVNLAVIQNATALRDDQAALDSFLTASRSLEVDLDALLFTLEQGDTAILDMGAAEAQAAIKANLLAEAQQQLAAANITLVSTYQQLADGAELSSEVQQAALDSVTAAQRRVTSLGGSATPIAAAGSEVKALGGEAEAAAAGVGALGGAMSGGLMNAMWMVMGIGPMLTYMFQGQSQAAQAAAQAQQQLAQAITQDGNAYGANTTALITNQIATSGAADTLKGYGISLTQASEYLANVQGAQDAVTGSLDSQIASLQKAHDAAVAQGADTSVIDGYNRQIDAIQATQQALDMWRQNIVDTITQQNDLSDATLNTEKAIGVFTLQVDAAVLAQQQQAQTSLVNATAQQQVLQALVPGTQAYANALFIEGVALKQNATTAQINATALNDSLAPQGQLTQAAINASLAYQGAATGTTAYTNALTALYGQYGQTSGALASFTTALDGLKGNITSGTSAVDLNTQAGAKNVTQFQQVASAAETYAEKLYQQTGNAQTADTALQSLAGKLDDAARKANLTAGQVQQLNIELFGVPNVKDIHIAADTSAAWAQVKQLMAGIDEQVGTVTIVENTVGGGVASRGPQARAGGGPVQAGTAYVWNEMQREILVPDSPGRVYPDVQSGMAALAKRGYGGGLTVHQNFYGTQWPSPEQSAAMYRELASAVGV